MDTQEHFTRLWTEAQPKVAGYIAALVPDFQEAEDLLQEVAIVLLRKFSTYDPNRPFLAWAMGIAKREVLMSRRRHARNFLYYQSDLIDSISESYEELLPELEERSRALRECLKAVRGRAKELLRLRYEEALPPRLIAGRVGMAVIAVRVMLSRTREALRQCIDGKRRPTNLQP